MGNSQALIRTEIAFIDGRLENIPSLLAGLPEGIEAHILNPNADGFAQMAELLAGRGEVGGVHVIGHGSSGNITLGTAALNASTLSQYSSHLGAIGQSLNADGDLLFYGCNVAAGENGQAFIEQIAALTGADVAASVNLTGAAALGGDWNLEINSGLIDIESLKLFGYDSFFLFGSGTTITRPAGATDVASYDQNYLGIGNSQIVLSDDAVTPGVKFYLVGINGNPTKYITGESAYTITDNSGYDGDGRDGTYSFYYGVEVDWGTVFNGVSGSTVTADFQYNGTTKTVTRSSTPTAVSP